MRLLTIGLIGCGSHGRRHLQSFAAQPATKVLALADTNLARAHAMAETFGVAHHYGHYAAMLERHEFDIVSIALPPAINRDAAIAAFAAGAHVMISKPLALDMSQAREIIDSARSSGHLLGMALQNRFDPGVQTLRRVIAEGALGHIYHSRIWHGHEMNVPTSPTLSQRRLAGGGALFHTTVHLLDAALWALGNPRPVRATAASYQKLSKMKRPPAPWEGRVPQCDIEDFNVGLVNFADGSTMSLESNWLMHPRCRSSGAEFLGDWGVASLRPLRIELEEGDRVVDATPVLPPNPPDISAQVFDDFCRAVRGQLLPTVRFGQMLDVQAIMNTLYHSAKLGREVELES